MKSPQFREFHAFLKREYLSRCSRNKRYSVRAFAKALDSDPSTLSKILSGKRNLGLKSIEHFGKKLGLNSEQIEVFQRKTKIVDQEFKAIDLDTFSVIAGWYHDAILELISVKGFQPDIRFVAEALDISVEEAKAAVARLIRIGFLMIDQNGVWHDISSGKTTTLNSPYTSEALQKHQRQVLTNAISAMQKTPIEKRSQYSLTFGIDPRWMPEARIMIKEFGRNLMKLMSENQEHTSVYQLSVSLFPVTTMESEK